MSLAGAREQKRGDGGIIPERTLREYGGCFHIKSTTTACIEIRIEQFGELKDTIAVRRNFEPNISKARADKQKHRYHCRKEPLDMIERKHSQDGALYGKILQLSHEPTNHDTSKCKCWMLCKDILRRLAHLAPHKICNKASSQSSCIVTW